MTPLIPACQPASQPASVAASGAGGGLEPGMAELAARTGWIFTGSLYLGKPRRMGWLT